MNHFSTLHLRCNHSGIESVLIDGNDITPAVRNIMLKSDSCDHKRTIAVLEIVPSEIDIQANPHIARMYTTLEIKKEGLISKLSRAWKTFLQETR